MIVLPFVESGAAAEQACFADAFFDDLTTQISRIGGNFVIGSATAQAQERVDIPVPARESGVGDALRGRLGRTGQAVEADVRLADAAAGPVVWFDVIEVQGYSVLHLRREPVSRLAPALGLELTQPRPSAAAPSRPASPRPTTC